MTLEEALCSESASVRLAAALHMGSNPRPEHVELLVDRCAVEPDFFVRDMLTWALTQHDRDTVVVQVMKELTSPVAQARSQALHTLSKLRDPLAWPAVGHPDLLFADEDEVATTAWRTAAGLVPFDDRTRLAQDLATQFGRGSAGVWRGLSQAMVMLGDAAHPVVRVATRDPDERIRMHALATQRLIEDPDSAFEVALEQAKRFHTLRGAPLVGDVTC